MLVVIWRVLSIYLWCPRIRQGDWWWRVNIRSRTNKLIFEINNQLIVSKTHTKNPPKNKKEQKQYNANGAYNSVWTRTKPNQTKPMKQTNPIEFRFEQNKPNQRTSQKTSNERLWGCDFEFLELIYIFWFCTIFLEFQNVEMWNLISWLIRSTDQKQLQNLLEWEISEVTVNERETCCVWSTCGQHSHETVPRKPVMFCFCLLPMRFKV